jgi:phosphoglycerate kinase
MFHYLRTAGKKDLAGVALARLDFNTKAGDWRMRAVVPTLTLLTKTARAVLILSHRGRPRFASQGKSSHVSLFTVTFDKTLSLRKDAKDLSRQLGKKVTFLPSFDFLNIKEVIARSPRGSVFLLENIRFVKEEDKNDARFAKQLAGLGDYFVNDAFAVSHRAEASVVAITKFLPSYVGLELENEIVHLSRVMQRPRQPLVAIFGGAKAADKLGVLRSFEKKAKWILVGGGCANTILSLRGKDVKKSLRDEDPKDLHILRPLAARHNVIAPMDCVWTGDTILDIGPQSRIDFSRIIARARTIVWSGPLGFTDDARYQAGTLAVARAIARNRTAFSVVGGGETVEFLKEHRLDKKFSFVSTGGGAMLDFLAGKKLPGIEALKKGK